MNKITGEEAIHPIDRDRINKDCTGLTIRAEFAARAMQGLLASCNGFDADKGFAEHLAVVAVTYSDALINALNKDK